MRLGLHTPRLYISPFQAHLGLCPCCPSGWRVFPSLECLWSRAVCSSWLPAAMGRSPAAPILIRASLSVPLSRLLWIPFNFPAGTGVLVHVFEVTSHCWAEQDNIPVFCCAGAQALSHPSPQAPPQSLQPCIPEFSLSANSSFNHCCPQELHSLLDGPSSLFLSRFLPSLSSIMTFEGHVKMFFIVLFGQRGLLVSSIPSWLC